MIKQYRFPHLITLIFILLALPSFAGQGIYLRLDSELKNTKAVKTHQLCLDSFFSKLEASKIGYIESKQLCIGTESAINITILKDNNLLQDYKINITANGSIISPQDLITGLNFQSISTLFPHAGFDSQDIVLINVTSRNDTWQKNKTALIADKPLNRVPMLGCHDSGSYFINSNSYLTPDATSAMNVAVKAGLGNKIAGWAKTQNFSIAQQLTLGVRYLDLRLCGTRYDGKYFNATQDIYACHSLSGASIKTIIEDIKNFINLPNHEKEIVIVDIGKLYNVSISQIETLTNSFKANFGNKIASFQGGFRPYSTYQDLWQHGKQIIIFMNDETYVNQYPDVYWSHSQISSPWPNTTDRMKLLNIMEKNLKDRSFDQFFVLQTQETPDVNAVLFGAIPFSSNSSDIVQLTGTYKLYTLDWLQHHKNLIQNNGNIILHDFVDGIRTEKP